MHATEKGTWFVFWLSRRSTDHSSLGSAKSLQRTVAKWFNTDQHGSTRINTDQQSVSTISFNVPTLNSNSDQQSVSTYQLSTPTRISNQFQRTDSQLQLGSAISFNSYQQSITTHQQRSLQHVSNNSNISMRRGVSQASRIDFRGTRSLDVATLEMSVVINQNNTVFFIPLMRQGVCPVASNPTHLLTGRN